ncbi:MAG: threonine/serine exporter family protein [Solirubrobacterales bacterium]|nr:threonine/serine exporter family protein [Solirubrobacterales bacterium]
MIPPLVTFLPGGLLTGAMLDLTANHLISGAARLVAGTMQLVLLTLGIAIGAAIAGVDLAAEATNTPINTVGAWAPWAGALLFGLGCYVHFSGPRRSLGWLLLVLFAAWIGEQLGAKLLSADLGAFVGAVVMTPVAAWVESRPSGPPSLATLMPAFWLLVPGALGLLGVAEVFGAGYPPGYGDLVNALVTFILIGLGVYVGNALVLRWRSRQASTAPSPS